MPARCGSRTDKATLRKAAEIYLDDGIDAPAVAERFGLSRSSVYAAVLKLRKERAAEAGQ